MGRIYYIIIYYLLIPVIGFLSLDNLLPPNLSKLNDISPLLLSDEHNILSIKLSDDEKWRIYCDYNDISPEYIKLLKYYEDRRFDNHIGIDIISVARSILQLFSNGRVISGASTITMQLVKMLENRPRTFLNKIIECFRAIQIEKRFTKKEILSMYLLLTPFGGNKEGIFAASLFYFNKRPSELTLAESTFLISIPNAPCKLNPEKKYLQAIEKQKHMLKKLLKDNIISIIEYKNAINDTPSIKKFHIPRHAIHLLQYLQRKYKHKRIFHTNIKYTLQLACEKILHNRVLHYNNNSLNAACCVIEHSSGKIMAYVGSSFYTSIERKGFIDMLHAIRSPGSTLKPFIYAIAFDNSIIHPKTILIDEKTNFYFYMPKNFDKEFHGNITAEEALIRSLNIPAVALLEKINPEEFVYKINNLGIRLYIKDKVISLPIALGGVGISIIDLISLYTIFPRYGSFIEPIFLKKDCNNVCNTVCNTLDLVKVENFCNRKSAGYINLILKNSVQANQNYHNNKTSIQPVPYKTGTSYSNRDAYSIGYTKNYVVGVWIGNADGTSSNMSGYDDTADILSSIVSATNDKSFICIEIPDFHYLNTNLSIGLQKFVSNYQIQHAKKLSIAFPYNNSVLLMTSDRENYVTIKINNGSPPFTIFIDGKMSVSDNFIIKTKINTLGVHKLYIIDNNNDHDSIIFEIKKLQN